MSIYFCVQLKGLANLLILYFIEYFSYSSDFYKQQNPICSWGEVFLRTL